MKSLCLTLVAVATMTLLPLINCDDYYLITTPTSIQPGKTFPVSITNVGSGTGNNSQLAISVRVSGTPYANSDAPTTRPQTYSSSGSANVPVGTTVLLHIKIGNWPSGSYVVSVNGNGGALKFKRTINIGINTKVSSLFIQTDKGIYQAGQTVQFRVIPVNSKLLPYTNGSLLVYINDGGGNRIKQWNTVIPTSGIFEGQLPLSTQPVEGQWSIQATLALTSAYASFTVTKYVPPRFSVTVTPPAYITTRTVEFPVTISAKYTYGQPVKGTFLLNITQTYCTYSYSGCTSTPVIVRGDFDGTATATIRTGDLNLGKNFEYGTSITVFGQVIEEFTGLQANDTEAFQTYSYDKQLSVTAPNDFSPGLPLTTSIALTQPDNTPIANAQGSGTVKFDYGTGIDPQTRKFTFNKDGTASVSVTPPEDATSVSITANYDNVTGSAYSSVAGSLSNKFISINAVAKRPQVGQTVTINVRSTFGMDGSISYLATGRGQILVARTIPLSGSVTQTSFSFKLTQDMSPSAAIAVFYITGCGEIVGDALTITVDGVFRTPLALQMSTNQSQPGDNITLSIKTAPYTTVALLSVDQSILLLNPGNDLTKTQVYNELSQYGSGYGGYYPFFTAGKIIRPGGGSLDQIFQSIGVNMVTNGLYYKQQTCRFFDGPVMFNKAMGGMAAEDSLVPASGAASPQVQPTRTRKDFPETWIFTTFSTTASGDYVLPLTVPDTITSWITTGFALNSKTGLGLTDQPTNLTVFKPFFLVVNLPYDVVRGESIAIQVLVYNYIPQELQVFVSIEQTGGQQSQYTLLDNQPTKNITVESNDVQAVTFLIEPTEVGYIPLTFKATSTAAGDAIQQSLKVKAEGVPQYFNKAILVDLRNQPTFDGSIDINVPSNAVEGSAYIQLNGRGNILAGVLQNLNNLVRLPSGCGEQNMVNFVPDVVILAFLTKVGRLTDDVRSQIINYLEIGYQTELTYKRYDGSFSAFGNVDNSGSTWLTAFVVRSFKMAKSDITIDDNVISSAEQYLIQSQADDGSFQEKGRILDNIQGGSALTPIALTAFVIISFLETPSASGTTYAANITKAVGYLEDNLDDADNAYSSTIVSYALQLAKSSKADEAFQKMNSFATTEAGDFKYWRYEIPKRNGTEWWYSQPIPLNVEATGYALLVYYLRNEPVASQLPVVAWLVSKQSSLGGYSSTQDTVIGIQALGQTGHNFVGPKGSSVTITVTYGTRDASFTFNEDNELVQQQQQILPNTIRTIQFVATGNGVAIVEVAWNYNIVISSIGNDVFDVDVDVTPLRQNSNQVNSYIVNVCITYKLNGTSGMVMLQLNTLSGYIWNGLPAVDGADGPQKVETINGNTVANLYYDSVQTNEQVCVSLTATETTVVSNRTNAQISIYRYYSNVDRADKSYNLP